MNLLIQLALMLVTAVVVGGVGYLVYVIATDILNQTQQKLQKHNVAVSSSGAAIGVKSKNREKYVDGMQKNFVSAWEKSQTLGKIAPSHFTVPFRLVQGQLLM